MILYKSLVGFQWLKTDRYPPLQDRFNEIKEGLLDWVLDKSLIKEEKFNQITKKVVCQRERMSCQGYDSSL